MTTLGMGPILRAALVAGLLASVLVAAFHSIATEPIIDQAIALEEQGHTVAHEEAPPMVSREVQKVGLVVGLLMYGAIWALLLAAVFALTARFLPGRDIGQRGLALAGLAYVAVALLPFLKYPANPPGVGEPDTIGYRQALYMVVLGLSLVGALLSVAVGRRVGFGRPPAVFPLATFVVLGAIGLLVHLALPANPDQVRLPAELLNDFRVRSLAGLTLFWVVLGVAFSALLRRGSRPIPLSF